MHPPPAGISPGKGPYTVEAGADLRSGLSLPFADRRWQRHEEGPPENVIIAKINLLRSEDGLESQLAIRSESKSPSLNQIALSLS